MRTTLKISEIIDEWILNLDCLPETKRDYRRKVELWFRYLSAQKVDPREPQRHHIVEYKRSLQQSGKSSFTTDSYVAAVRLYYRYCSQMRYYDNIGDGIKSTYRIRGHFKEPLTANEAERLVESIHTDTIVGKRDRLLITLMLTNGLRCCEAERIDIGDFEKQQDRTLLHIRRKGRSDKSDVLAVPETVVELYEDYISCRDFELSDPLFLNHRHGATNSDRLGKNGMSRIIKHRLKAIGINNPKITAHSLRHTCGSLLVESGTDVEMIKDLLGHTNTATTRIYIEQAQKRRLIDENPSRVIEDILTKRRKKIKQ